MWITRVPEIWLAPQPAFHMLLSSSQGEETNFENFKNERFPSLTRSEAFERFAARQILKNDDLSDDEVESGILGGDDDGGVDGLGTPDSSEFWWLNNGVTILAGKCYVAGSKLVVERPEVVNGLQTSHEIFQFFKDQPEKVDGRNVLIRVIVPPDEQTRTKIIRATNSQTPISEVSLHATDPIHFDIEEKLKLYQLFYERRKGEYRELRKPVDQIVSIQTLARAVMARAR